jgi:hypothetical protein
VVSAVSDAASDIASANVHAIHSQVRSPPLYATSCYRYSFIVPIVPPE